MNTTAQALSSMTSRQKLMGGFAVFIVFIIFWQAYAMFSRSAPAHQSTAMNQVTTVTTVSPGTTPGTGTSTPPSHPGAPQPASMLSTNQTAMQNAADLIKQQQDTQAKYIAALNELQLLKLAKDIAEANQAIMAARLNTIMAQKRIVDTLTPKATPFEGGVAPPPPPGSGTDQNTEISYSVVSVSQLQYKWTAVINSQGKLYNVAVGDILPVDGSKVISINKTGVVLELKGQRKKYSLVPII